MGVGSTLRLPSRGAYSPFSAESTPISIIPRMRKSGKRFESLKSENHPSLFHIFRIARENKWLKFWDVALEYGYDGSKSSLAILKSLCLTVFSDRHCLMQNCPYTVPQGVPLCQHFFECHTEFDSSVTPEYITDCILFSTSNSDQFMSLIPLGLSLLKQGRRRRGGWGGSGRPSFSLFSLVRMRV